VELMRILAKLLVLIAAALAASVAPAQQLTQAFDSGVPGTWVVTNNSIPIGSTDWFTGNSVVFPAQAGAGYAAANFNAAAYGGAISDWLISPALSNLQNGEVLTFWTRTEASAPAPDSMEVRLSLNGASTNVGGTAASVGDFTTLFLAINPTLTAGGYPSSWTQFTVTLSGLPAGVNAGRVAFRYVIPDTSTQGDYIGLDTVNLTGPPPLDLSLTKGVNNATPILGSNVTFTLTVSNTGATTATNVVVTDLLPAGLVFVSAAPSQGGYVSGTGLWTVGSIASGGSATLTLVATVNALAPVTNTASITSFDQVDPNPANNTASAGVSARAAAPAAVPAAGPLGLAILASILALAGLTALRRGV
jgi:uncharacterized repeat protein (TIGR01451 family)